MSTPGIGDPYWYEWFVGLRYVIEMLNPDSTISSVSFQCEDYDTIDDVVVEYADGNAEWCYQVKHEISTSKPNNLTFGKMLEKKGDKHCLFYALFLGWKEATTNSTVMKKAVLYTNRKMLDRRAGRTFKGYKYSAYSLEKFIELINYKFVECQDTIEFLENEKDLEFQWNEFLEVFGTMEISELRTFLSGFLVEANQPELIDMKQLLVNALIEKFSCNEGIAQELFSKLLMGLSEWTIATRKNEKVTLEDVYSVLGLEEDINNSQHRLAPPYPFFESRQMFCENLETIIRETDKKVVFISGSPGSGKTSTISYLQSTTNIFMFRYHTFRPISPEQHFYNEDPGMYTTENLWGTLLIQLRKRLKGKLAQYEVPVSNKLVNIEDLRMHVLRLLSILGEEAIKQKTRVFICIDGIDHAARANNQISFLDSLPLPNEIPVGVCFVIVGQPMQMYKEQYPLWLSTSKEIEPIEMTKLEVADIKQLILEKASRFKDDVEGLANLINIKNGRE